MQTDKEENYKYKKAGKYQKHFLQITRAYMYMCVGAHGSKHYIYICMLYVYIYTYYIYICKCVCIYIAMSMNNCVRVRAGNVTFLTVDGLVFIVEPKNKTISDS